MSEKEDPIQLGFEKTIDFLKSEKVRIDSELSYCEKGLADHLSHLNKPAKKSPGPKKGFKKNGEKKIPGLSEALEKAEKEASLLPD